MNELWRLTATELAHAYRGGVLTPVEVLTALEQRIETVDSQLNAFTAIDDRSFDRDDPPVGADAYHVHGIPIAVKELIAVAQMPHTGQSLTRDGVVAVADAAVVSTLRSQGAAIVGTTRTHEFAFGITTQHEVLGGTTNPWNRAFTPGGSSGGSGAAVAAGMVPIALGSDTACSVRLPAAFNGVCGFRPTHGVLSVEGVIPLAPSFDTVGVIAREVSDISAVMWSLTDLSVEQSPFGVPRQLRVGVASLAIDDDIGSAQRSAHFDTANALEAAVDEVVWPHDAGVRIAYGAIAGVETLAVHKQILGSWPARAERYGTDVRSRMQSLDSMTAQDLTRAREAFDAYGLKWTETLERVDVVLLPASGSGPSPISNPDMTTINGSQVPLRDAVFPWQASASLLGLPACSVPVGIDENRVPIGVQVIGRRGEDARVLEVAAIVRNAMRSTLPAWPAFELE